MAKTCGFCEKSAPAGGRACRCSVTGNVHGCDHPCDVEDMPRLTPEEVQRCRAFGAKWVSHDMDSNQVWLWEERPELKPSGVWDGGTSCVQAWARFFPSVQPGQLVPVEGVS